ncbi:uncharacterized protein BX663DRAFT_424374, partial [Cokeromyces recurvatus]|uniref:uncharacterized protein n=1 Tax=Cokeromyces recurvatus TaxID=90255 RepID=UPI00221F573F
QLLQFISTSRTSQWSKLSKNPLWRQFQSSNDELSSKEFTPVKQTYRQQNL